jgi:hypothetical protein
MDNPKYRDFHNAYVKRFNMDPDVFAAHAYDGMNMIIKSKGVSHLFFKLHFHPMSKTRIIL